jgi:hypothetical protein
MARRPQWIQPCTAREDDALLLRRSWWQLADKDGIAIPQYGWHRSILAAHRVLKREGPADRPGSSVDLMAG